MKFIISIALILYVISFNVNAAKAPAVFTVVGCNIDGTNTNSSYIYPSQITFSGTMIGKCSGFYTGNLVGAGDSTSQANAALVLGSIGLTTATGVWAEKLVNGQNGVDFSGKDSTTVNFSQTLSGVTYLGFHWGKGQDGISDVSAFFMLDFGDAEVDSFTISGYGGLPGVSKSGLGSLSNAVLYTTTIPPVSPVNEPDAVLLMLAGLLVVVFIARRRHRVNVPSDD